MTYSQENILANYKEIFSDDLPPGLPRAHLKDHAINLIRGSTPPCKVPFRQIQIEQK